MGLNTTRRRFVQLVALSATTALGRTATAAPSHGTVEIKTDPAEKLTQQPGVAWALEQLQSSLEAKGTSVKTGGKPMATIVVASVGSELAKGFEVPGDHTAEMTVIVAGKDQHTVILVSGLDGRGITYGLLELADRIRESDRLDAAFQLNAPIVERTPNRVRSVARAFCSEIEDKSWFYDRAFWTHYLDNIASARFNRFNFALGFGYDFPTGVTGDYLHFPYPYLVKLAAYPDVRVDPPLAAGEREKNLETLQFIAKETRRRGLDFQLGLWTHAYQWTASPHADHQILGLTPETHAAYCRAALEEILKVCPEITGLTLRIHGESGIPEGSYPFWETLFEAIRDAGRPIEIDMHAKGLNQTMIDIGHKTGMRLTAGAKFWAEHLGLGYHQADIRATEYPRENVTGTFAVSNGARNFTRYGYGDFYQQGSEIEVLYRAWPGTQRHLLWADLALASGYGHAAHFCGAAGMELCEPLTFKGREGSGHRDGRNAYANRQLASSTLDAEKFELTYLIWGRSLYNPDSAPQAYKRSLRRTYGSAAEHIEVALASSSRILPLVTTAWLPSASNHSLWPELYTPISILPTKEKPLYSDSPAPHNVGAISPLDPQIFLSIDDYARALLSRSAVAHYHPLEVAQWIDELVSQSSSALATAQKSVAGRTASPAFRRAEEDILILNGLGGYYAGLFRAALCYSLFQSTGNKKIAAEGIKYYRKALESWKTMATRASSVYTADISYGSRPERHGHWADRIPMIEKDVFALEQYFAAADIHETSADLESLLTPRPRPEFSATHSPATFFRPGASLELDLQVASPVDEARLWYRHVNHGERWSSITMQRKGSSFQAAIPSAYTQSPFPLQYYFEIRNSQGAAYHPPLNRTLSNQPYFAVHRREP
ncbi:hypothetical protein AB4Y89_19900 [Terriglobus sp. 2YAB30_2]|uniref:hypothetical protein n=2 Tax=unclassified Terriglobus TaxID=2628988 RepID=UPI003F961E78